MSLAVKHNGVFVTWLITKYDWSRKACLRTSSVMPPLPSLYYEYSPILLPPNSGASLFFIRSRRSRLESPRSMRNSALSTYSSVLSSKAQTSGFSCLNNSTICLSRLWLNTRKEERNFLNFHTDHIVLCLYMCNACVWLYSSYLAASSACHVILP